MKLEEAVKRCIEGKALHSVKSSEPICILSHGRREIPCPYLNPSLTKGINFYSDLTREETREPCFGCRYQP